MRIPRAIEIVSESESISGATASESPKNEHIVCSPAPSSELAILRDEENWLEIEFSTLARRRRD
jgi:hypothetical protein